MEENEFFLTQRVGRSLASLETLIDRHDVVSFDIFDTLLCRKLWVPSDVFKLLERRHGLEGFAETRVKAEWLARRRFGIGDGTEVTLEQIYLILDGLMPGQSVTPAMELSAEAEVLVRDPSVGLLFDAARRKGKRVIGISDSYLSGQQIDEILRQQGIHLDHLYCSSDYCDQSLGKFNQRIFVHVARAENVQPSDIVHFGDNQQADVLNANAMGFTGVRVRARRDIVSSGVHPFMNLPAESLSASFVAGQVAIAAPSMISSQSPLYSYGYAVGGPLLMGFCLHILRRAKAEGVTRINLFARDGYVIEKALKLVSPEDVSYAVMPMSRRMAIFPMLAEDRGIVQRYLFDELKGHQTPRAFWERLGLDPSDLHGLPEADISMPPEQFLAKFYDVLIAAANTEREALVLHLKRWNFDGAEKTAVVDVGWGLSTLRALDNISDARPEGYFVGIQQSGYHRKGLNGYLFDRGIPAWVEPALTPGLELIELFFSDTSNGFGRIALCDGSPRPEQQPLGKADFLRNLAIDEVQRGGLDFVKDLIWAKDQLDDSELADFNRRSYARLIRSPQASEYRALADVPHSRTAGHGDWKEIGHFWRTSQSAEPQHLVHSSPISLQTGLDVEQARIVQVYGDLLPKELKVLAKEGRLAALDWRKVFWSNPFNFSRWRAIRRYQRRAKRRNLGSPEAK